MFTKTYAPPHPLEFSRQPQRRSTSLLGWIMVHYWYLTNSDHVPWFHHGCQLSSPQPRYGQYKTAQKGTPASWTWHDHSCGFWRETKRHRKKPGDGGEGEFIHPQGQERPEGQHVSLGSWGGYPGDLSSDLGQGTEEGPRLTWQEECGQEQELWGRGEWGVHTHTYSSYFWPTGAPGSRDIIPGIKVLHSNIGPSHEAGLCGKITVSMAQAGKIQELLGTSCTTRM